MVNRWHKAALALWILAVSPPALAEGSLTITVDPSARRVRTGDVLSLTIKAISQNAGRPEIELPEIRGLSLLSQSQSQSSSMSFGSGGQHFIHERTLRIDYSVDSQSAIQIPAIVARTDSTEAKSRPLTIELLPGGSGASTAQEDAVEGGDIPPPDASEGAIFARLRVDRAEVFVGQQVLVDLELYVRPGVGFSLEQLAPPPEMEGFWREMVDQPRSLRGRNVQMFGRQYQLYRAWRVAMFPLNDGEFILPALPIRLRQSGSFFDRGRLFTRHTKPVKLVVKALPEAGKPAGFRPTHVGQFRFEAQLEPAEIELGKAAVIKLKLSGEGNLASVKMPEMPEVEGIRSFPPTVEDHIDKDPEGLHGDKAAEILLMPQRAGRYAIPALVFHSFDPQKGRYETLRSQAMTLVVKPSASGRVSLDPGTQAAAPQAPSAGSPKPALEESPKTASALEPLRYRSDLESVNLRPWSGLGYQIALALPPFAFVLLSLLRWQKGRKRQPSRRELAKNRKNQLALAFSEAQKALKAGRQAEAHAGFSEALIQFLEGESGQKLAGLTREAQHEAVLAMGLPEPIAERLARISQKADYARFGGSAQGSPAESDSDIEAEWQAMLRDLSQHRFERSAS